MNEYEKKASDFAKRYGVRLTSRYVGFEKNPEWTDNQPMDHWKCRLIGDHTSFTFDFWMGIGHNGATPTMYDVLSCMTKYGVGSFEEFCDEYGYSDARLSEYPRVMKVYRGCQREWAAMQRLFPSSAFEELREIC